VHVALEQRPADAANVACLLPGAGAERSDTAIVFTAHYDHLGFGAPDESGDSLYNGFSDNAAGVAMLLAIAQSLAGDRSDPLGYSAVFLFPSGEERGLLGSDYYVVNPLWPLERTAAVINLDAGAPPAPPTSWHLAGVDSTGLGAVAIGIAAERDWDIATSSARPNSDYYPFAREGVPALFIIPGPAPYEGLTADSSKALRRRWDHYHQPGDEWAEDFPFSGLGRYAGYALLVAREIDAGALGS
jgi:Zn-dependent M28 family amino/carboxypeptidase